MEVYSYTYSIPYVIVLFILVIIYLLEGRKGCISKIKGAFLSGVVLLFFIGLRGHLNTDFINYYISFENTPVLYRFKSYDFLLGEPGFVLYTSIIKTIWNDYHFFVFVNTLIDIIVLSITFKRYSNSVTFSFICFFVFYGLQIEFDLFRNAKGIDCFLLSIPFLLRRKFAKYLLLIILGTFFHYSTILYLPFYFILTKKFRLNVLIIIFVFINVIYGLGAFSFVNHFSDIFSIMGFMEKSIERVNDYISDGKRQLITPIHIQRSLMIIIMFYYYKNILAQRKSNIVFFNCFFIYYLLCVVFSEIQVFVQRFPLLFLIGEWILIPNIFEVKKKYSKIVKSFICLVLIYYTVNQNKSIINYYDNICWGIISYQERADNVIQYQNSK